MRAALAFGVGTALYISREYDAQLFSAATALAAGAMSVDGREGSLRDEWASNAYISGCNGSKGTVTGACGALGSGIVRVGGGRWVVWGCILK